MQIKFVFETEKELIDIAIDEFEFLINNWLIDEKEISKKFTNDKKSLYSIKKREDIRPGFFEVSVLFGNSADEKKISEENISSLIKHVIIKMSSVSYCGLMLTEVRTDDIIIKKKGKRELNNVKIDQFRFIEELNYSTQIFQSFTKNRMIKEGLFSKISLYVEKKIGLNNSGKKSINDLTLKTLIEQEIMSKEEFPERNDYNLNEYAQNYFFRIIINPLKILFIANFRSELFQKLVYLGNVQTHPTPLAPHISGTLILLSINNSQNIEFMKNETFPDTNELNVIFIDPFCGYGTIPLIFYINAEFFLNFLGSKLSSKIEDKIKNTVQIKSVEILGFDSDNKAIEMSNQNLERITKFNKNSQKKNVESSKISISFNQAEISSVFQNISYKITSDSLVLLVTQPPYGFTIKYSEEYLNKLYHELLELLQNLRKKCPVSVALISTRKDLLDDVKKTNEFTGDTDIEQIALNNNDMIKIKRADTISFIYLDFLDKK